GSAQRTVSIPGRGGRLPHCWASRCTMCATLSLFLGRAPSGGLSTSRRLRFLPVTTASVSSWSTWLPNGCSPSKQVRRQHSIALTFRYLHTTEKGDETMRIRRPPSKETTRDHSR